MRKLLDRARGLVPSRMMPGDRQSSNITMLAIAAAFLLVTIGLILVQPDAETTYRPDIALIPSDAPVADTDTEVSRADASLLTLDTSSAAQSVSAQLRQPIRLTDTDAAHTDLRSLTAAVLTDFGHAVTDYDRLHGLLVQALTEGQSNAYIDALLNTALTRGDFIAPAELQTASGRLNTDALLMALVAASDG